MFQKKSNTHNNSKLIIRTFFSEQTHWFVQLCKEMLQHLNVLAPCLLCHMINFYSLFISFLFFLSFLILWQLLLEFFCTFFSQKESAIQQEKMQGLHSPDQKKSLWKNSVCFEQFLILTKIVTLAFFLHALQMGLLDIKCIISNQLSASLVISHLISSAPLWNDD